MNWSEVERTLKAAAQERRGAQSEIARRLGIKPGSVSNYITGTNSIPPHHLDTILAVLGMTLHLGDASTVDVRNVLIAMTEQPDRQFFESDDRGRQIYRYGETEIAGTTDLVWYTPARWWVKLRDPKFRPHALGTLEYTGDSAFVDVYRVVDGPFKGYRVAASPKLIHLSAPDLPGMHEVAAPFPD
ncbi:helix-turn-helix domain-containing protein [Deinococcus multiflagellatus]|uniref:Helix-turn-helix domain-containing protein n=1 Tax=Deinococcus multiflagellatus TaxID=1656887 RepID=A0ABW1ZSA4_9DEIO|nr:helix-turn-helix transcriptional regulator [Deinococcus multiflagellatus]MBZ9714920.1 helix-turn-helix domain-containing protein [Deinococcus multiflagellatus]